MMNYVSFYLLFSIALLLAFYVFRKFKLFSVIVSIVALFYFSFIVKKHDWTFFDWAKGYLVNSPIVFYLLARYWYGHQNKESSYPKIITTLSMYVFPWILFANILVVVFIDFQEQWYYNTAIGALLCFTIPQLSSGWSYNKDQILGYGQKTATWTLLYTAWNTAFIYNNLGKSIIITFIPALIILIIPLLYCIVKRDWHQWIFIRLFSLFFLINLRWTLPNIFPPIYRHTHNTTIEYGINFVSALLALLLILDTVLKKSWRRKLFR